MPHWPMCLIASGMRGMASKADSLADLLAADLLAADLLSFVRWRICGGFVGGFVGGLMIADC